MIIKKLEFHRMSGSTKHINDIRGILAETALDEAYLQQWIDSLHLEGSWALARGGD